MLLLPLRSPVSSTDQLERFIFENTSIRGNLVRLNATWLSVTEHHDYPPALKQLLGELLAASALLSATLKFQGSLVMQIQGKGPVSLLVVECTSDLGMRATAKWDANIKPDLPFHALIGGGICIISLIPENGGKPYQGIVPLEGNSVAQVITNYMQQSEQLETSLWLAVDADCASGLLLQKMPEHPMQDPDDWNRIVQLAATVQSKEITQLEADALLHRLFNEDDIRLFEARPTRFQCTCSIANVVSTLRMLGKDDMMALLKERGRIEVLCEFCNRHYEFDSIDVEQMFISELSAPTSSSHH